ncbi:MAG: flagellar biosynthetic protein FliR [Phycisphaerae bacterium]
MPSELLATYLKLPVFALVVSRLGGLIMFQPIVGGYGIPRRVQVLLVLGLAALVTPFVQLGGPAPDRPVSIMLAMGNELLLGVLMGLAVRMCFLGLQVGGQIIAQESGLAFGRIADPTTGAQQSIFSSLYLQLGAVVFLIVGGHRVLLSVALDTFNTIPLLGDQGTFTQGVGLVFDALTLGAEIAVRVAAPAVLTLFLVNAAMGFVSRTVPQFNILTIGFSIKGLVSFILIAISLPAALEAFIGALETVVGWIAELVKT